MAKEPPRVVEILSEAWDDLREGAEFYNGQADQLGERFMDEMIAQIQQLTRRHGTHSQRFDHFFALADVWPWAMYYVIEGDSIIVTAVLDCRRDPSWIAQRVAG